jgi:uncharacterized protein YajQ (UPF0234 family)
MPSFDIVSKVDTQTLDNAINAAKKEILNRFDFRNSKSEIDLNKKDLTLHILTEDNMRLDSIVDVIRQRMIKHGIQPTCLDEGKEEYASGNMLRKDIKIKQGIDKETSKKIMSDIKSAKTKATAQIMGEIIRVQSKSINELQSIIGVCRKGNYDIPLQFENMK